MAMEKLYVVRETHTRGVTAIGYNAGRREIVMGFEDGVIKTWESESGRLVLVTNEHHGWVTHFMYWHDEKLLLSGGNDGVILAWSAGGSIYDRIEFPFPIHCIALNTRRQLIILGVPGGIKVFLTDEAKQSGHILKTPAVYNGMFHTDIVRNVACNDMRIISAGYDRKLIIYDSSYCGDNSIEPIFINHNAHDAGITCLIVIKDAENTWMVTGSFDKTVKIWTAEGQMTHKMDTFLSVITGICFVPKTKTVWVAGGTNYASLFDPVSGENVSDFISTFQQPDEEDRSRLQLLLYLSELNLVLATTSRRHLTVFKYNSSGCMTTLRCRETMQALCYTNKAPILIFSGNSEGSITKWERMQSNHFMYSKELFSMTDLTTKKKEELLADLNEADDKGTAVPLINKDEPISHYSFNKPAIPPISTHEHPNTSILKIAFVEHLDKIIAASEDGNIYVWGFDEDAVAALALMKPPNIDDLIYKYSVLLDNQSELLPNNSTLNELVKVDSVMNRVAGFICKYILEEHMGSVTSFIVITPEHGFPGTYVLSGGWDRRLCLWDIEKGILVDTFKNKQSGTSVIGLYMACDGVILDMDYNPGANEFAYSSSDGMVYIRRFSINGSEMTLLNTLQGHDEDITCIRWNAVKNKWITGSDDGTIRIWAGSGMNENETILSAQGSVTCMCIDRVNGAIIAGVQKFICVFDADHYTLLQTNVGHTDAVKSVIHIPERNQYVSCSYDQTIRVWNAVVIRKRHTSMYKKDSDKSTKQGNHLIEDEEDQKDI